MNIEKAKIKRSRRQPSDSRKKDGEKYFPNGVAAVLRFISDNGFESEADFARALIPHLANMQQKYIPISGFNLDDEEKLAKTLNKRHGNDQGLDFRLLIAYGRLAGCHNLFLLILSQFVSLEGEGQDRMVLVKLADSIIDLMALYKKRISEIESGGIFTAQKPQRGKKLQKNYEVNADVFDDMVNIYSKFDPDRQFL